MTKYSVRELATRIIAAFDRRSEVALDRALVGTFRQLGLGRFESDDEAYRLEGAVLAELRRRDPEDLPFRICGRRLVGKARSGLDDSAETVVAKGVEGPAQELLDKLTELTPSDFEIVCAAALRLAGAREMTALCTGDEGGIDFYGRLEVRQQSERVARGIIYTTILPKELLVLGQAKRYSRDAKIGRPELQKFKGQLDDCLKKYEGNTRPPTHRVPDSYYDRGEPHLGVFVTTASFSEQATQSINSSSVVLVTGLQLAQFLSFRGVGIDQRGDAFYFEERQFIRWVEDQRPTVNGDST